MHTKLVKNIGPALVVMLLLFVAAAGRAGGMELDAVGRKLADAARAKSVETKDFSVGGGLAVLDFVDMTEKDQIPRLGGGTAGLGRYLRNAVMGELERNGMKVVDPARTADALKRLDFRLDDIYDDARVQELLNLLPGAIGLVTGEITPSGQPVMVNVETTLRQRVSDGLFVQTELARLVLDKNVATANGTNVPPLSDNRPNVVLKGHPFRDAGAPYRLEVIGSAGAKPLRFVNSRVYVAGEPGEKFSLRLVNNTRERVAAAVFIDLQPCDRQRLLPADMADKANLLPVGARKIVIPAGGSTTLDDWSQGGGAPLVFQEQNASGGEKRFWNAPGLISAAFYPLGEERTGRVWELAAGDAWTLRESPAPNLMPVTSSLHGQAGEAVHSPIPAVVLNVHYENSERVKNFSRIKED